MIKYELDENNFLTGNFAYVGQFERFVELDKELNEVNKNLQWNGTNFILSTNPKEVERELRVLREEREKECFSFINRGQMWYETLSYEQKQELRNWYIQWLDVTETKIVPDRPTWLK